MAQTDIDRSGSFTKLGPLEGKLRAVMPIPLQVYGTPTGLRASWPNGLTATQITQATTIINAYVEPTDVSQLTQQQINAFNFLANNSPTAAQQLAALKGVIRFLLKYTTGKDAIDGTDISS